MKHPLSPHYSQQKPLNYKTAARAAEAHGLSQGTQQRIRNAQPEPAPAGPDWAVLGPRLAAALKGAQKAMREALPMVSADEGHNGVAVFVGEWLDEVNEVVALLPA